AVGNSGVILTSENGADWTSQVSGTEYDLRGIAFGKNAMVFVGGKRLSLLVSEGVVLTSPDGLDWEVRGLNRMLRSAVFGDNSFLAVGYHDALLSSYDTVFWNQAVSGFNISFAGAVAYRGQY